MTLAEATVEHVIPLNKGGSRGFKNASLACKACNNTRGDRDFEVWQAFVPEYLAKTGEKKMRRGWQKKVDSPVAKPLERELHDPSREVKKILATRKVAGQTRLVFVRAGDDAQQLAHAGWVPVPGEWAPLGMIVMKLEGRV
jgi:hypothetical protein